jgi:hypothetical protein
MERGIVVESEGKGGGMTVPGKDPKSGGVVFFQGAFLGSVMEGWAHGMILKMEKEKGSTGFLVRR